MKRTTPHTAADYRAAIDSRDYDRLTAAYERAMLLSHDLRFRQADRETARLYLGALTIAMRDAAERRLAQ